MCPSDIFSTYHSILQCVPGDHHFYKSYRKTTSPVSCSPWVYDINLVLGTPAGTSFLVSKGIFHTVSVNSELAEMAVYWSGEHGQGKQIVNESSFAGKPEGKDIWGAGKRKIHHLI